MKRIGFLLFLLFFYVCTQAQEEEKKIRPLQFSGQSKLYGQYSNREGYGQLAPANYLRWSVSSNTAIYGIPINISFLLSTEQQDFQQQLNTFTVRFDYKSLLRSEIAKRIPFLTTFKTLEFGTTRPTYSPLVLNGIRVNGLNVEWNPGLFYAAVCYGKSKNLVAYNDDPLEQDYSRNLFYAALGVGKKEGSHFKLSVMKASDREGAVTFDPQSYTTPADSFTYEWDDGDEETYVTRTGSYEKRLTPAENFIGSADFALSLFEEKFLLGGNAAVSLFTSNINAGGIDIPEGFESLEGIINYFSPNLSSHIDWGWNAFSKLTLNNSRVNLNAQMTGPGYQSLGTSYIRSDNMEYSGTFMQFFARKQISFFASLRSSYDNLTGSKPYRTYTNFASLNLNFRFRNLPYLQLGYNPFRQYNNDEDYLVNNSNDYIIASAGYRYKTGSVRQATSVSFTTMTGENINGDFTGNMNRGMFRVSQSAGFSVPLKLTASYSVNSVETDDKRTNYNSVYLKGSYGRYGKPNGSLGVKFQMNDSGESKLGFAIRGEFPVWFMGKLQLSVEQNFIENTLFPDRAFNELIARFALITTW